MDAYNQVILGEEVIDEARQMKDPKKDSMVVKGGKTIVIDKSKEKEYLSKGWKLAEKKKLDPVDDAENDKKFKDRKDKDIDNDGDVDSSDEYLHKKRAATDDAIDGGKKPAKKVKEEDEEEESEEGEEEKGEEKPKKKDDKKKDVATSPKTAEISKIGEDIDFADAISNLFLMWESAAKQQKSNATEPEGIADKESPKSKEFMDAHKKSDKKVEDNVEDAKKKSKSAEDATKAKSGKRSVDNDAGDTNVVKSTEVKEGSDHDKLRKDLDKRAKDGSLEEGLKTTHVLVDTAQGNKIVSTAAGSNAEKNLKSSIASAERPPMNIKDKKTLKIVQLKKPVSQKKADDMMGQPLKEELEEGLVTGVRGKDGNTYAIELGRSGRKGTVRTKNQHGDIDTVDLKKAAKMFEGLEGLESLDESAEDIVAQAQNIINGKSIAEIADLTSDKPVNKYRRNPSKYDGRTREAKEFLKRMAKRQGKKIDSGYKGGY